MDKMKKIVLMVIGAMVMGNVSAQMLHEGEAAMVYYSPKTMLDLEFEYTVETHERGIYADFAEDMLGAAEYVSANETNYQIKDVKIGVISAPNYDKPHKVSAESGIPMLLYISEKGLLKGYNIDPAEPEKRQAKHMAKEGKKHRTESIAVAPYNEEVLKAANIEAQAFETAKQIFHIRETRNYLLNGEVEHVPADGKAMELVLAELAKQEEALTELFVGKREFSVEKKHFRFSPSEEKLKFYFSEENGFTNGDNIDADSIVVTMQCKVQEILPLDENQKKKKQEAKSEIVYTIPGSCAVEVVYQGQSMAQREVPVAQFGAEVALPLSWFTGKELPKIIFSEKTGNILRIDD